MQIFIFDLDAVLIHEGINGFFDKDKMPHFENILTHFKNIEPGIRFENCILFDDLIQNIDLAKKINMRTKLVNYVTGITINDIEEYI